MSTMGSEDKQLHMLLFPFMAHGHIIPMVDMAKLFASRGIKITIVTTPRISIFISKSIQNFNSLIELLILKFPLAEVGLPDSYENVDSITIPTLDLFQKFHDAINLLQPSFEQALLQSRPDCIVTDAFFPWTNDVAAKFEIPRLIFHGISFFSLCSSDFMAIHKPYNNVSSDTEPFLIPDLPGDIKITRMKLPSYIRSNPDSYFSKYFTKVKESESNCYGVIVNSFYELEAEYADCYRDVLGRKAWTIGPLSLCNKETQETKQRGKESAIDELECLQWLDSQKPNTVVYVCFGSLARLTSAQHKEIAIGLELSGKNFIWVVRKKKEDETEDWFPEGFEERMEGKGLIVKGWAPQVLILNHPTVGGFVTHCGWNSTLEGVVAGVPMVTWPSGAEQFYNEKLVTEVLKIGVGVGVQKWRNIGVEDFIVGEAVEKAIRIIMDEEEGEEMRNRATEFAEKAKMAVHKDGSSYRNLNVLIQDLKSLAS